MMRQAHILGPILVLAAACAQAEAPSGSNVGAMLRKAPATSSVAPETSMVLGAARAGARLVAVGARGMVLLSDDGQQWRQAREVPVRSTLNAVSFVDAQHGWAVGHNGVILTTNDAGETWSLQRFDDAVDQPLFSVHFLDAQRGVAVGLWSLMLVTNDGGATWREVVMPASPGARRADRNLLKVFADPQGTLFVAAERGMVLRSRDGGQSWTQHETGYKGSLWTGAAGPGGDLYVAGLRGTMYRSMDQGETWVRLETGARSSLTDLAAAGSEVIAVGLDGTTVRSSDQGRSFTSSQRDDRLALTALVARPQGGWQLFSKQGIVKP